MSLVTRIGICLACVLALFLMGLDIHYVRMLPAHADIDYSRAGFGIFLQVLAVAYLATYARRMWLPSGTPANPGNWLRIAAAMLIPAFVCATIGSDVLFEGLHASHLPIPYRGVR